jgi:hypothetical protein
MSVVGVGDRAAEQAALSGSGSTGVAPTVAGSWSAAATRNNDGALIKITIRTQEVLCFQQIR